MNCPGGVLVYASKPHSYRELPIRAGEIGLVHRHELRGACTACSACAALTRTTPTCLCVPTS